MQNNTAGQHKPHFRARRFARIAVGRLLAPALVWLALAWAAPAQELLGNGSLETVVGGLPQEWDFYTGGAGLNTSAANARTGDNSLSFIPALGANPQWDHALIPITAGKTYRLSTWYRTDEAITTGGLDLYARWWQDGTRAHFVGQQPVTLAIGKVTTAGWKQLTMDVLAPVGAAACDVMIWSGASGALGKVYFDDFSLQEVTPDAVTLSREARPYSTVFPKMPTPAARLYQLKNFSALSQAEQILTATAQGLINATQPRVYLMIDTYDSDWMAYLISKGATQSPQTLANWSDMLTTFASEFTGKILYDPALPGAVHAACMIASVTKALPVTAALAGGVAGPVVEDLTTKGWTRNVDAYNYVFDHYWAQMNHHILASVYPLTTSQYVRDYLTAARVFTFWRSAEADNEPGADPAAETAFINKLFAATPASVPLWGWFSYGASPGKGITEYEGMKWASQYGKFLPGNEFSTNLSVHSGYRLDPTLFQQTQRAAMPHLTLDPNRIYVCMNVLDSGDAQWYWQRYQTRTIWNDAARGTVPVGWCMSPAALDTQPWVMRWFYEKATPRDEFFTSTSGLGYMFTTHFGEAFTLRSDRDAAWEAYLDDTRRTMAAADINAIETYNGAWNELSPPPASVTARYTRGVPGLRGMFPDLGRTDFTTGDNADYNFDGVHVLHCLSRWITWTGSDIWSPTDAEEVQFARDEILNHLPSKTPGFMNALMISWRMKPSLIKQVADGLPANITPVTPTQMWELRDQYEATRNRVLNGDFEAPALDHWSLWQRGGASGTATLVAENRNATATQALKLTRTSAGSFAQEDQVFITTQEPYFPSAQVRPNHNYVVSFYYRSPQAGGQKFHFSTVCFETPVADDAMTEQQCGQETSVVLTADTNWQQYTVQFHPPADRGRRLQLQFRLADGDMAPAPGELRLDDVRVVEDATPVVQSSARGWQAYDTAARIMF
jgi:hypothetical protein